MEKQTQAISWDNNITETWSGLFWPVEQMSKYHLATIRQIWQLGLCDMAKNIIRTFFTYHMILIKLHREKYILNLGTI